MKTGEKAKGSRVKGICDILERSEENLAVPGEADRRGSTWFLFVLLLGTMLFANSRAYAAGGLKQSVIIADPSALPEQDASVDAGGRTSCNVWGTDGALLHQLLTDGNGRLYVNINNNNAAAAPTNSYFNSALTGAATVTSSNGHYYGYDLYNPNVSVCYLQIFSTTTPTLGTTVPVNSIPVPATSRAALSSPMSSLGPTAGGAPISIAATTTPTGSTLCTTGMVVNAWYTNF